MGTVSKVTFGHFERKMLANAYFDVPEVKLFLLMIAEIILYLIAYLCNRENKDMYIRLFKVSVLMTLLYYISRRI